MNKHPQDTRNSLLTSGLKQLKDGQLNIAEKRFRELRSTLRQRILNSSLCDGPAYAKNIETAYRSMLATKNNI